MGLDGSGVVKYDYGQMEMIAGAIHQCGATAESLLAAGNSNRMALRAAFESNGAAPAFDTSFNSFSHVNQQIIEITNRGGHSYGEGSATMLTRDMAQATYFPGAGG